MQSKSRSTPPYLWLKPAVFVGALTPVAALLLHAWRDELGANPISQALNQLGLVALIFLVAALTCTPLKTLFGWTWPLRLRRMLGLYGFAYATLHVSTYVGVDQFFDWQAIVADIVKRPFIFVGFAAFVLLIPLAVTSTTASIKRLGYPRWKQIHRLAYIAPLLGVLHFTWRVKKDVSEPSPMRSLWESCSWYAWRLPCMRAVRKDSQLFRRKLRWKNAREQHPPRGRNHARSYP